MTTTVYKGALCFIEKNENNKDMTSYELEFYHYAVTTLDQFVLKNAGKEFNYRGSKVTLIGVVSTKNNIFVVRKQDGKLIEGIRSITEAQVK